MKQLLPLLFFTVTLLQLHAHCTPPTEPRDSVAPKSSYAMLYDLEEPDKTYKLPNRLEEISGIALSLHGNQLLAVQDEDGIIFAIDKASEEVVREIDFWKDGDYEDIEVVDETVYVVKSTGTIYEVLNFATDKQEVNKYNDYLTGDHDIEGLCYDDKHHRLLLTCKGQSEDQEGKRYKAVYAFNLVTKKLEERPAFLVSEESVKAFLDTSPLLEKWDKIVKFFDPNESVFALSPSAIAAHPLTDEYYILSSVGKMLVITDRSGNVKHIQKLDKDVHRQPEGICFEPDGTLYISNEGKGGSGKIYRFDRKE